MRKKREGLDLEKRDTEGQQRYSDIIREPDPWTGGYSFAESMVREVGPLSTALSLKAPEYYEGVARRNLERVGDILRRLDLQKADILELRMETRAILADLAA